MRYCLGADRSHKQSIFTVLLSLVTAISPDVVKIPPQSRCMSVKELKQIKKIIIQIDCHDEIRYVMLTRKYVCVYDVTIKDN